jgi:hypothetical protein
MQPTLQTIPTQIYCPSMPIPTHPFFEIPCCDGFSDLMSVREVPSQPAPRIILTSSKAVEIYKHKLSILQDHRSRNCPESLFICLRGRSVFVSSAFNVSPKTIRDIWTRRTWQRATCHLWEDEDSLLARNHEARSSNH